MEIEEFINRIPSKVFDKLRNSQGDAECRRYLRVCLSKQQTVSNETISKIVDKYRKTNITNKDFSDRLTKAKTI